MLTGRTGLQSPLPISKPSERVSGRGGSGNHRWVNREGSWVVVWQMCPKVRFPVEKVRNQQGVPWPGLGSLSLWSWEWSQNLETTSMWPREQAEAGDPGG